MFFIKEMFFENLKFVFLSNVICAISQKKIPLENLTYWNIETQEAYFSYVEASMKRDLLDKN